MTQPQNPLAQDEKRTARTEFTARSVSGPDQESETIEAVQRSGANERSCTQADPNDDAAMDTTVTDTAAIDSTTANELRIRKHITTNLVLPLLVMGMAAAAGYLKYQDGSIKEAQTAATSAVQAATDGTIALLSYRPDTAQTTLTAARDRLTGPFRNSYTSLTNDVVIPGAQRQKISATATVPAASSVSASENHAVVLLFVDQSIIVGNDAPSATSSVVQLTLDKSGNRWLISGFDPK